MNSFRRGSVAAIAFAAVASILPHTTATAQEAQPEASPPESTSDWLQVDSGGWHSCGIRTSGRLYCWGKDGNGELGNGAGDGDRSTPSQVTGGATNWASVSVGSGHTCARKTTGRIFCWGRGNFGQIGDGRNFVSNPSPVEVAGGATNWVEVSAGGTHTCARRSSGQLFCWGRGFEGQLGHGAVFDRSTPGEITGGATDWTSVSTGATHTCARKRSGRLYCWGNDENGGVGDGGQHQTRILIPVEVSGGATNWSSVAAGDSHTCARKTTGRLFCWGEDGRGQLGDGGASTDRGSPVQVAGGATSWTSVRAGSFNTCARRSSGRLYCWGSDIRGQVGNGGGTAVSRATPAQVAGGATVWTSFGVGNFHSCATTAARRLFCWGSDSYGELGNGGADTDRTAPAEVAS